MWVNDFQNKPMIRKIGLLTCLCLIGMSFIKPGRLKKIVRVEVNFDREGIYPGNLVDVTLTTTLKDSTKINSTASNLTVNFSDYVFELEGGATIQERTRTKLTLRILDEYYTNPQVKMNVYLRRKPAVHWQINLPIRYDVTQKVVYKGGDGYDPRANTHDGYRKIPITKRVNIEFIDNEQTLTNNSDPNIIGEKGPDLKVYVSLVDAQYGRNFVKVNVQSEFGDTLIKYIKPGVGDLEIHTVGGRGGISRSGGKGGDGGDVTVFITEDARPYFDQIFIVNHGGEGGDLWRPKVDGQQQGPYGDDGQLTVMDW